MDRRSFSAGEPPPESLVGRERISARDLGIWITADAVGGDILGALEGEKRSFGAPTSPSPQGREGEDPPQAGGHPGGDDGPKGGA